MADNTRLPIPETSGDLVAADDIGGVKFQRVKMTLGADGANDGDVSATNPLPVEIQGSLGTAGTKELGTALVSTDVGLVTNTVIHGLSTGGGGGYVDVKVTPSGALSVQVGESALPTGAATETTLTSLNNKIPLLALSGRIRTEELGTALVARQLAAGASSDNTALTTSCRRISIHARGGNIRFAIGSSSQTASGTSHYIAQGERIDLAVPATPNIAVIRADSTDCTLELMELGEPI